MAGKIRVRGVQRKRVYAVGVDADNDKNGNPCRGWFIYDASGAYLGFLDEGYNGGGYIRRVYPNSVELLNRLPTLPGAYRAAMQQEILVTGVD